MLIQQIIRKQTISILDKILQSQVLENPIKQDSKEKKAIQSSSIQQKHHTIQQYLLIFKQKKLIKDDQKQILNILLRKHSQVHRAQNNKGEELKFNNNEIYVTIKQIKRSILDQNKGEGTQQQTKKKPKQASDSKQTKQHMKQQNQFDLSKQQNHKIQQLSVNIPKNSSNAQGQQSSRKDPYNSEPKEPKNISGMSKKLKKQSQFIARNINRIKSYSTSGVNQAYPINSQASGTVRQYQLTQQLKISNQISNKLFHLYKPIYPSSNSTSGSNVNSNQLDQYNFDNKQQYKLTLNYHKILQIFVDCQIKLQIENKLSLLRLIKKFSFNQNMIQIQQWRKIYHAIIQNLGIKEVILQRLVKIKEDQKRSSKFIVQLINSNKNNSNNNNKTLEALNYNNVTKSRLQQQYRTRKVKTQSSILQSKFSSLGNIITQNINSNYQPKYEYISNNDYISNQSDIRPIGQLGQKSTLMQTKEYNANKYRNKHKKLLTDTNQVIIKNIRKQLKQQKMIGLDENKNNNNRTSQDIIDGNRVGDNKNNQVSYLKKAIKNKKISKLTWQSLFDMKEETMYYNIIIPQFAKSINQLDHQL